MPIFNPSVGLSTFEISASGGGATSGASSAITQGSVVLCAGSNITLSQTTGVSANSITIIGGAGGGAAGIQTISASGTSVSGTAVSLALAAGANITLNTATGVGSMTVSIAGPNATNFSLNGSSSSVSLVAGANITLNSGASSITIVGATPNALGTNTISASGTSIAGTALSLALAAGANVSLQTNTGAGSMTVSVSGLNALSFSGAATSTGTMILSAGVGLAVAAGASTATISITSVQLSAAEISASGGGATSGASAAITSGSLILCAGSNITLSQTTGTSVNSVTIIGPASSTLIAGVGISFSSNGSSVTISTTGAATQSLSLGTTSVTGTAVSLALVAGANISLSVASGAGSITATVIGSGVSKISATSNLALQQIGGAIASATGTVTGTAGFGSSLFLQRVYIPAAMTLTEADIALGISFPATSQGAGTLSQSWGLFSFSNSTKLVNVMSTSGSSAWSTGTSTTAGATSLSQFQGGWSVPQILPLTFASTSTTAGEYVVGNLINFAQGTSTWSIALYGALANQTSSQTINPMTSFGQTSFAAISSVATSTGTMVSSAANLAITNVEATNTFTSVLATLLTVGISGVARTFLSASTTAAAVTSVSGVTATGVSSLAASTISIIPVYLSVPNFIYVGTGPATSAPALPSAFLAGIMSTGAMPAAITLSSAAVTMTGTAAGAQPYWAIYGN